MSRALLSKSLLVGLGLFGIAVIWPIFNTYVPIFLAELGTSATLIGFVMAWDNYLNLFIQPVVGDLSDRTQTHWGRRKPWMMVGAPLGALFFVTIPAATSLTGILTAILLVNFSMALFRSPTSALLGDLFSPSQRSTANGILNLMGGLGAIAAFIIGGLLYRAGRLAPFAFGSVVLFIAILVVVLFLREPTSSGPSAKGTAKNNPIRNLGRLLQTSGRPAIFMILAILSWSLGFRALETWISSFGKFSLGIDPGQMSLISGVFALAFVLFAVPSGLVAGRTGRKPAIMTGLLLLGILLTAGLFIENVWSLIVILALAGGAWALINVNALPLLYDVGGTRIGALTGLYFLAVDVASVAGPQVTGFLIDLTGKNYRVLFAFGAFFVTFGGILLAKVRTEQPKPL